MTRPDKRAPRRPPPDAFTLLEVLISSAILLTLLVLLFGACEGGSRFWNHAERRRAPLREAGAALRFIARDLRSAVITSDASSLRIGNSKDGESSLFFLVSHPRDHRPETAVSDLCATGYFLASSRDRSTERDLYRFHASGREVFDALREGTLAELYASASPGSTNTELLARHVASLRVRTIGQESEQGHPAALSVGITTVDPTAEAVLSKQTAGSSSREELLMRLGARLGTVIVLPSMRETNRSR